MKTTYNRTLNRKQQRNATNFRSETETFLNGDIAYYNSILTSVHIVRGVKCKLVKSINYTENTKSGRGKYYNLVTLKGTLIAKCNYQGDFKNLVRILNNYFVNTPITDKIEDRGITLVTKFKLSESMSEILSDYNPIKLKCTIKPLNRKKVNHKRDDLKATKARIQKLERVLLRVNSGKQTLAPADLITYTDELNTLRKGL